MEFSRRDQPAFVSCDWGTTSFRLRYVSQDLRIIDEIRTRDGVKTLHDEVIRNDIQDETGRTKLFGKFLRAQMEGAAWPIADSAQRSAIPLIICNK